LYGKSSAKTDSLRKEMDLQTSKLQSEIRRIENESATKISNMSEKIKEVEKV